jgi:enediyne biosynthesis protein E4
MKQFNAFFASRCRVNSNWGKRERVMIMLVISLLGAACSKPTRFESLPPEDTGIRFNNIVEEKDTFNILHNEYMYNGGGVGIADLNNDGLQDVIFSGNKISSRIYLNNGDFRFTDITSSFENIDNGQWYSGVVVTDINQDGWADVYLTSTTSNDPELRRNRLWVNQGVSADGSLKFREMASEYGIDDDGYGVHAGFFDYDLDGDLDLYILNNIVNKAVPTNYRAKIIDGTAPNNDRLYRNEGNGKFTNVTMEAGIVYEGFGLGLAFGDVNKDGYPDIYVSNDYISNDILYINKKDGTFENATKKFISYQSRFSMGNDMADCNNDGNLDIITMDMMPEEYSRKKQTINGNSYLVYINNEKWGYETQYVRNMLHVHNGFVNGEMMPFSEVGQMAGVFQTEWSWSPLFADFDNDGDKDLAITNGFPKDLTDKDFTNYKAQVYGFVATDRHILPRIPIVKVPNYAFENKGDLRFEDLTEEWGMRTPSFSNGAAFVDLDNDGDLDYVVNNINDPAYVYRNNSIGKLKEQNNFLRMRLKGSTGNLDAAGTKVELFSQGTYQYHEHFPVRGYISSVEPIVHFGLGKLSAIDSVKITWPDGRISLVKSPQVNQLIVTEIKDSVPRRSGMEIHRADYLFEDASDLIKFRHQEEDYVDFFQSQRILQHKLSQIGPCMAKGDINGDEAEDILIGGSLKSPTKVFLNQGGKFVQAEIAGLTSLKKCDEADLAVFDVDNDGDNDVVTVAGGSAGEKEEVYRHLIYINNGETFSSQELPLGPFPASVIRPHDFDKDGDVDIFIGSRFKLGSFPESLSSVLLINDAGQFTREKTSEFELGMVTDATWTDIDKDGYHDLVVVSEWGGVTIYQNDHTGLKKLSINGADKIKGLWYSVSSADLDMDGDNDLVVGNLGDNHRFTISENYPLTMYGIDIDNNGSIDPLVSSYWNDRDGQMQEYPVNYLDELASQSPVFRKKFTSYTRFSFSTMDSILAGRPIDKRKISRVNSTSSYILWNDGNSFSWEKLPIAAQTSPIRKVLIKDFNGDNFPDMLLTGNDFSYDVSTGIYNANKGVVLVNRGNRKFENLAPSGSGIYIQGQVNSLLFIEKPRQLIVAGINRDSLRLFYPVKSTRKEISAARAH